MKEFKVSPAELKQYINHSVSGFYQDDNYLCVYDDDDNIIPLSKEEFAQSILSALIQPQWRIIKHNGEDIKVLFQTDCALSVDALKLMIRMLLYDIIQLVVDNDKDKNKDNDEE